MTYQVFVVIGGPSMDQGLAISCCNALAGHCRPTKFFVDGEVFVGGWSWTSRELRAGEVFPEADAQRLLDSLAADQEFTAVLPACSLRHLQVAVTCRESEAFSGMFFSRSLVRAAAAIGLDIDVAVQHQAGEYAFD